MITRSFATFGLLTLAIVGGAQQETDTAPPLRIVPDPREAKIALLNIEEGYEWGMPLKLGTYHVEVSAPGYRTARQWLEHNGSEWYRIRLVPEDANAGESDLADVHEPDIRLEVRETSTPAETPQPILRDSIPLAWLQATAPGPLCAEAPEGTSCWAELVEPMGCYAWVADPPDEVQRMSWDRGCSRGLATGSGTLTWPGFPRPNAATGMHTNGKRTGHWSIAYANGTVAEGPYLDGLATGHWIVREASGTESEGPYVDGRQRGQWVVRHHDARVEEGWMDDNRRNGAWTLRDVEGNISEGQYVNDKRDGNWTIRDAEGNVSEGPFVNGQMHGSWIEILVDGTVSEGQYVGGKRNGKWIKTYPDGTLAEGPYTNDQWSGRWKITDRNGHVSEGLFANGNRSGRWTVKATIDDREELIAEGPYVGGKRHGPWTVADAREPSIRSKGPYIDGLRQGTWTTFDELDNMLAQGQYENDQRIGEWVEHSDGEISARGPYVDGKKHGAWSYFSEFIWDIKANDERELGSVEGLYKQGDRSGQWTVRFPDEVVAEGQFQCAARDEDCLQWVAYGDWTVRYPTGRIDAGQVKDFERTGRWEIRSEDGNIAVGPYVEGKKHGQWEEEFSEARREGPYENGERHGQWTETWNWQSTVAVSTKKGPWKRQKVKNRSGVSYVATYRQGRLVERVKARR